MTVTYAVYCIVYTSIARVRVSVFNFFRLDLASEVFEFGVSSFLGAHISATNDKYVRYECPPLKTPM